MTECLFSRQITQGHTNGGGSAVKIVESSKISSGFKKCTLPYLNICKMLVHAEILRIQSCCNGPSQQTLIIGIGISWLFSLAS